MTLPYSRSLFDAGKVRLTIKTNGVTPEQLRKQLPYALTFALNRSTEEALLAGQMSVKRALIIRKEKFLRDVFRLRRRSSVKDFQTNGRSETVFGLRADDFRGRASVFVDQEEGGVRQASGSRAGYLYIGTFGNSLRPTIRDLYAQQWYPKALGLADRRAIDGSTVAGRDQTKRRRGSTSGGRKNVKAFVVRARTNKRAVGIFRRTGQPRFVNGRDQNLEMLFTLSQRRAIRPKAKFRVTSERTGLAALEYNVPGMLAYAIDRAGTVRTKGLEALTLASLPAGSRITTQGVR